MTIMRITTNMKEITKNGDIHNNRTYIHNSVFNKLVNTEMNAHFHLNGKNRKDISL